MSADEATPNKAPFFAQIILFLLSISTLSYEINLTRIFSITQFYHFAFMIVSLALLGFGASGTFLSLFQLRSKEPEKILQALSFGTWVSILGSYLVINWVPFDSFSIAWDIRQMGYLLIQYVSLATPFFFNGLAVGYLLSKTPKNVGNIYAVNLGGSAVGCVITLIAPTFVEGEGTVLICSSLAACGTVLISLKVKAYVRRFVPLVFSTTFIFLAGYALVIPNSVLSSLLDLRLSPYKSLSYAVQHPEAEIVSQTWNSYSRIDIVESPGIRSLPGVSFKYYKPPPPELGLFVDGDNLSPIVIEGSDLSFTGYLPTTLAFTLRPRARTLVLEPRGGLDVLTAINEGANQVTVVEPNELILGEADHVYSHPDVSVVTDTVRSFLRQRDEQFDLVILSLTETYHPVRSGAYSLSEDYRYTLESFQDAMENLSTDGLLVVTRWLQIPPSEWLRSFILAVSVLEELQADPSRQIAALRSFNTGVLLVKNSPFNGEELETIRAFSQERAFDLVYLPDLRIDEINRFAVLQTPFYYQTFTSYLSAENKTKWLADYPYDVSPPSDDHPFYGHYFKWKQAGQIIAELGKSWQPFGGGGYFVILVMLAFALILSSILIILPLGLHSRRRTNLRILRLPKGFMMISFGYFGFIGLAFLFIEIPLIQYFILYLGHPAYSLTIVLFTLLLFSGIGSQISHRVRPQQAMLVLVCLSMLNLWLLPSMFDASLGFSFWLRMLLTVIALAPLGILMGMPFPNGIRRIEPTAPALVPWVWGINGAISVVASILAMLLALSFGYKWVMVAGGLCYFAALLLLRRLRVG